MLFPIAAECCTCGPQERDPLLRGLSNEPTFMMKAAKYGDLFRTPNPDNPAGYQASFKKVWSTTLRKAGIPYFRIYDLRSTYATRLSAGGVADEWVTQLLRQGDAKVFKKYSQIKLQMKREALAKLNRKANDKGSSGTGEAA